MLDICQEYPEQFVTPDPLAMARSYHDNFIENHSRHFVGRKAVMSKITEHILTSPKPVVILGEPGSGMYIV